MFGTSGDAQPDAPAPRKDDRADARHMRLAAAVPPAPPAGALAIDQNGVMLPKTATDAELRMIAESS